MVLCKKNTWIGIHFFPDEVTMPHDFGNILDDSRNDFYHPNQSDEMSADHDGLGNQHEDPDNGLDIDPSPLTWLPDFSNHLMTDEVCWLVDNWFYICVCVCCVSEEFSFMFLQIEIICCTRLEIWGKF